MFDKSDGWTPHFIWGRHGLMVMASDCGLGGWGSIPGRGKSLTPGFVFK